MKYHKYLFVINPIGGGLDKEQYVAYLRKKFDSLQAQLAIMETSRENDRQRILEEIQEKKPEVVVAMVPVT